MRAARLLIFSSLLSFNGGFVDVACFFGLKGLLAAHITGNLATLGVSLALGRVGLISKIIAVPEFMVIVALTQAVGRLLEKAGAPLVRILLGAEVLLLALFLALGVLHGPFADPDTPAALLTALAAIAAMAVQNGIQRAHLPQVPPTTFMTGNATQASIDGVNVLTGRADALHKRRLGHIALNFGCFAFGCGVAAVMFLQIGFWSVAITLPAAILAVVLAPEMRP
jgi:uncharacterized membrane protein YoaK (UPF0700 family)